MDKEIIPLILTYRDKCISKFINGNKHITIEQLFLEAFESYTSCNMLFYTYNCKLICHNTYLHEIITNTDEIIRIDCFDLQKGGGLFEDIFGAIFDAILSFFEPIVKPVVGIGRVFIFLIQLLIWFGKFVYWAVFFLIWLFTDILNPINLVTDFWNSIILILITVINTIFGVLMGLAAFVTNQTGQWMQSFWGWDQSSLTKKDKNSKYFKGIDRNKGRKCYATNNGKVPFSILLGTILCPPLGVFMDRGLTGWMNIFICTILTVLFYLPGLFYALLIIYS